MAETAVNSMDIHEILEHLPHLTADHLCPE